MLSRMKRQLTHGSLFSGIGGAELAAHWAGFANLFHCEINPFGRKVLDYWFPNSESYSDVTKQDFTQWRGRVDVLSGGFPCQPFSSAGRRKGSGDNRYLWPQFVRAIREIQPAFVIGENVNGLLSMVEPRERVEVESEATLFDEGNRSYRETYQYTIERICQDLETEGYEVQPFVIPACAVGAPHQRDRVWIVARRQDFRPYVNTHGDGRDGNERENEPLRAERGGDVRSGDIKRILPAPNPDSAGLRPLRETADLEKPRLGRQHTDGLRLQDGEIPQPHWQSFPTQSPILDGDDGVSIGLDGLAIPYQKFRQETIKAMGNAWVPQVAFELFKAIAEEYEQQTASQDR